MSPAQRERFGQRCDSLVHGGVIALLAFSPLAFGAVHAWSQAVVEWLAALLAVVWASKALGCGSTTAANERLRRWGLPLLGFGLVALVQLLPLPPPALRVLSPNTYELYRETLPGWPRQAPFGELRDLVARLTTEASLPPQAGALRSVEQPADAAAAAPAPVIEQVEALAAALPAAGTWRPLSLYTYRSGEEFLRMLTYGTVFFCSLATRGRRRAGAP
ncbi:MAG: hypothetical protein HY699_06415 [Deltaproteobacteria bacterium]|nr:hypothetical protein [Deltaproteobacteria bacterium]